MKIKIITAKLYHAMTQGYLAYKGNIKKNVTKNWKKFKGGGGSAPKIKKSKIQNFDFLIRGEGRL